MKSKKTIIIASAVAVLLIIVFSAMLFSKRFDAKKYVEVVLNQTFYGEVEGAAEIIEGVAEEELHQRYEDGITAFVKNNIISGVQLDEAAEAEFIELGKKIFASMKFEVVQEEKMGSDAYSVKVQYEPSDVFLQYVRYINEENKNINEKVQAGEYKGSVEQINVQIQKEFLEAAYTLLEKACSEMSYGQEQEMEFVVKAGESGLYQISEDEVHNLMIKIMRLDEIQD